MNKFKGWILRFVLCSVAVIGSALFVAPPVSAAAILCADVAAPGDGCMFLGIQGSYYANSQEALDRINEMRLEACSEGVKDPRNPSRNLTEEDYVPLQWSQSLELIARLRSAETVAACQVNGTTGHFRLNGRGVFSVSYGGITSSSENLAWNGGTGMLDGIEQWYEEKEYWVNNTSGQETGHYTSLINPNYRYIGVGAMRPGGVYTNNVVCSQLSTREGSLGTEMLPTAINVTQTIEVRTSYLDDYTFLGKATLNTDQKCQYTPQAMLLDVGYAYCWLVDDYTMSISDTNVATLDDDGVITALRAGTFTLSVESGGKVLGSAEITVKCNHDKILISKTDSTCSEAGSATYSCDVCGTEFTETIGTKAHDYKFGSAGEDGRATGVCRNCGDEVTVMQPTSMTTWWNNSSAGSGMYSSAMPGAGNNPVGSSINYMVNLSGGEDGYLQIVFESSNENVISSKTTTASRGSLPINSAGITTLKVYPLYNPSLARTFTIRAGSEGEIGIELASVADISDVAYSGSDKTPAVTVAYRGTALERNTDYTVAYSNNRNAGDATVTITGKGIFSGSVDKTFKITPLDITSSSATLAASSFECDGTAKEPGVTVTYSGRRLTAGTDYEVEYTDNVKPGTAAAVIRGIGNYTGEITRTYVMKHSNHTYGKWTGDGENHSRTCDICGDIQSEACDVTEEVITAAGCDTDGQKKTSCKVCGYENTSAVKATGHQMVDVAEKKASMNEVGHSAYRKCSACDVVEDRVNYPQIDGASIALAEDNLPCDGTAKAPSVSVCDVNGTALKPGEDYTVTYSDNVKIGTGTATVVFTGHYTGSTTLNFTIYCAHEYGDYVVDIEPSCTAAGQKSKHCKFCGNTADVQEIPPAGHKFGDWTVVKTESCSEEGAKERTCSQCKVTETEAIDMADHQWEDDYTTDKEPSCTENGSRSIHCMNCNAVTDSETIPALGHNLEHFKAPAKIGIAGKEYDKCTVCQDVFNSKTLAALKPAATKIVSLTRASKAFTVKWTKKSYTGYQIRYSLKSSMASAKMVTVSKSSTVSRKITKLKAKKKYYVQVRTYKTVNGKKVTSVWSSKKAVTTK